VPNSRRRRFTVAKVSVIGSAPGSIMPIIITHHIRNASTALMDMAGMSGMPSMPRARCARYSHDSAVTPASAARMTARSRRGSAAASTARSSS
jgi:hypothetical protein